MKRKIKVEFAFETDEEVTKEEIYKKICDLLNDVDISCDLLYTEINIKHKTVDDYDE